MKRAGSLAEVRAAFEGIEEKGGEWFSNFLATDDELACWIEKGQILIAATPKTAVLLRQRHGCQRCYFANVDREPLTEDLKVCLAGVTEKIITTVLDRGGQNEPIKDCLRQAGFLHYALLKRIVKINEPTPPDDMPAEYATMNDLSRIEEIIHKYFDPLLDHWPDRDEIADVIEQKRILVARCPKDGQVAAMTSFIRKGKTVWGRYWASMEEYRAIAPYGAIVADQYMVINSDVRKYIGWVADDNVLSIRMNKANGFSFDGTSEEFFIIK